MPLATIAILFFSLFLFSCNGGVNSITIGADGATYFNKKDIKPANTNKPKTTNSNNATKKPQVVKPVQPVQPVQTKPQTTLPVQKNTPVVNKPVLPGMPSSSTSSTSLMDGLSTKTKTVILTQREGVGMPKVNGERIEADVYGKDTLIIRYTSNILKVRYSNKIAKIDLLGEVENMLAKVPYPVSFVKLYVKDQNGDTESKIFGIVDNKL